jgi:putative ubiquitin-RnfH superfamily antitoxin RatB of RatAB toxin-antitoxin module
MSATLAVTVVYAAPDVEAIVETTVAAGSVVADAVAASGVLDRCKLDPRHLGYAIFGQRASASTPLVDGDRVELTRPLAIDPKEARRRRAARAASDRPRRPNGGRRQAGSR